MALAAAPAAIAQTGSDSTWDGSTDTNWFTPANWSDGTKPSLDKKVLITTTGLPNYPVLDGLDTSHGNDGVDLGTGAVEVSRGSLTIQNGGKLTTNQLVLKGDSDQVSITVTGLGTTLTTERNSSSWPSLVVNGGLLTISSGAEVISKGFLSMSDNWSPYVNDTGGTIRVTGAGSKLTLDRHINIGMYHNSDNTTSYLRIEDGGYVHAKETLENLALSKERG